MATSPSLDELRKKLAEHERKNILVTQIIYEKYEVMDGESQQGERAKCATKRTDREENIYLKEQIKAQEQIFERLCAEAVAYDKSADAKAAEASDDDY
jgi:hypothetical protein